MTFDKKEYNHHYLKTPTGRAAHRAANKRWRTSTVGCAYYKNYQKQYEKLPKRIAWKKKYENSIVGKAARRRAKHTFNNSLKGRVYNKNYEKSEKRLAYKKEYYKSTKTVETKYVSHIRRNYGISVTDYNKLLKKQHGKCAICYEFPKPGRHLCVDHAHTSGKIRGLLCVKCNIAVGHLKDSVGLFKRGIRYLNGD